MKSIGMKTWKEKGGNCWWLANSHASLLEFVLFIKTVGTKTTRMSKKPTGDMELEVMLVKYGWNQTNTGFA